MKASRSLALGAVVALNIATVSAAAADYCEADDSNLCFQWGVPQASAHSSSGDIYFQLSAPTSYQWIGLGIGTGMAGADIFIMYQNGKGNVTLSTRQGVAEVMPDYVSRTDVQLIAGSGVINGKMVANVKCSNGCSGLSLDGSTNWISAWKSGSPLDTSDVAAILDQHDDHDAFQVDLSKASISSDTNPFVQASGSASATASAGATEPTDSTSGSSGSAVTMTGDSGTPTKTLVLVHSIIMTIVFVGLYPLGAILKLLISKWYIHASWQFTAFLLMWVGFGIGYTCTSRIGFFFHQPHTCLGIVVVALLGIQPVLGYIHHAQFKKTGKRTFISYIHIWYGRILMILGVVNGGLGLQLAEAPNSFVIAYSVLAGVFGAAYIGTALLYGMRRKENAVEDHYQQK